MIEYANIINHSSRNMLKQDWLKHKIIRIKGNQRYGIEFYIIKYFYQYPLKAHVLQNSVIIIEERKERYITLESGQILKSKAKFKIKSLPNRKAIKTN